MIDTDKYEWDSKCRMVVIDGELYRRGSNGDYHLSLHDEAVAQIVADAPLLLAEVKRLREEVKVLSKYRDIPEDEWNFEQHALIRMKELIE